MYKTLTLFLLSLFIYTKVYASDLEKNITECFSKGDISLVSNIFADNVNLITPGENLNLSKDDAEKKLEKFIKSSPPKKFNILHNTKKGNTRFLIGNYICNNKNYRIHILIKENKNIRLINQIRIESLNE